MSKGHRRRPNFVPLSELAARWDATFGGIPHVHIDPTRDTPHHYEDGEATWVIAPDPDDSTKMRLVPPGVTYAPATTSPSPSAPDERPTE